MKQTALDFVKGYNEIKDLWMRKNPTKTLERLSKFHMFFLRNRIFDVFINPSNMETIDMVMVWFFFHTIDREYVEKLLRIPPRSKSFSNEDYIKVEKTKKRTIDDYIKIREFVVSNEHFQVAEEIISEKEELSDTLNQWIEQINMW